jgi:glucosamine 6-phosphate synthetase-like amidotransferase/phosphosugar isomerase protein
MKMNVATVSAALLSGIASRGPDATGAAWYDAKEQAVKVTKIAVNVAAFLGARKDILPQTTPVMLLHTRMATHGSTGDRLNNHPVRHENIIGIHNGVLWNDDEIFKTLKMVRNGEVDSEAIMALLARGKDPTKVLSKIGGDAAVAWIDLDDPDTLHIARVSDRPVHIAQTEEGSLVFASTKAATDAALKAGGLKAVYEVDMEEAKYMKVQGGVIAAYLDIPNVRKSYKWSQKYAYTSGKADEMWDKWDQKQVAKRTPQSQASEDALFLEATKARTARQKEMDKYYVILTPDLVDLAMEGDAKAVSELHARGYNAKGEMVAVTASRR